MKIAVISDVHGNLVYLRTCLGEIERLGCDVLVCLGDTVGYFPDALPCMEELESMKGHHLLGNHEAMLLGLLPLSAENDCVYRLHKVREVLPESQSAWFGQLLPFWATTLDARRLLFVHGSPWDPLRGYVYPDAVEEIFGTLPFDAVFMGHTHRPFCTALNGVLVVNVGSCGLPRDVGNSPSFAVYDTQVGEVVMHRVVGEVEEVLRRYGNAHPAVHACLCRKSGI